MRAKEFVEDAERNHQEKLDEFLPLVTGAASLAGGVMKGAGAAIKGAGKAVGAVGKVAAKGIKKIGGIGNDDEEPIDPKKQRALDQAKQKMLRPGQKVTLPSDEGGEKDYKITKATNKEVELQIDGQEGPNKVVYDKDAIKKSMKI